jgi:hypothetical protein
MLSKLAFIGELFTSAIGFAQSLPSAPHRRVVTVSTTETRGNEPSIAVNFNNANQVVRQRLERVASVQCESRATCDPLPPTRKSRSAPLFACWTCST